jgi:hypothetical protein
MVPVGLVEPVGPIVPVELAGRAQAPVNSRATKTKIKQTLPINTDRFFFFMLKITISRTDVDYRGNES